MSFIAGTLIIIGIIALTIRVLYPKSSDKSVTPRILMVIILVCIGLGGELAYLAASTLGAVGLLTVISVLFFD